MTTATVTENQPAALPPAGQNVYTPCKKCGVERYQKVLAHKTATSAQVQCEVCGAKKTYKLPSLAKAKKPRAKKAAAAPKGPSWESLKEEIGTDEIQPYKMTANFETHTAINHPKFGVGFVTMASPQKIEVVFESGPVALVHNRA